MCAALGAVAGNVIVGASFCATLMGDPTTWTSQLALAVLTSIISSHVGFIRCQLIKFLFHGQLVPFALKFLFGATSTSVLGQDKVQGKGIGARGCTIKLSNLLPTVCENPLTQIKSSAALRFDPHIFLLLPSACCSSCDKTTSSSRARLKRILMMLVGCHPSPEPGLL